MVKARQISSQIMYNNILSSSIVIVIQHPCKWHELLVRVRCYSTPGRSQIIQQLSTPVTLQSTTVFSSIRYFGSNKCMNTYIAYCSTGLLVQDTSIGNWYYSTGNWQYPNTSFQKFYTVLYMEHNTLLYLSSTQYSGRVELGRTSSLLKQVLQYTIPQVWLLYWESNKIQT